MAKDLYTLRRKGVMLIHSSARRQPVYFLQLTVRNALSRDSLVLVNLAIEGVQFEWPPSAKLPGRVVRLGIDGVPKPGAPIFDWKFEGRAWCFDDELPDPVGYLGEREIGGFLLRTSREGRCDRPATVSRGAYGETGSHIDFRVLGRPRFADHSRMFRQSRDERPYRGSRQGDAPEGKLDATFAKIVSLIHLIESKGQKASPADIQFLGCLKQKVVQLSHPL